MKTDSPYSSISSGSLLRTLGSKITWVCSPQASIFPKNVLQQRQSKYFLHSGQNSLFVHKTTLSRLELRFPTIPVLIEKGETEMMFETIKLYLRRSDEDGVTTVEYAIMLALVAVAVALATPGISDAVTSVFDEAVTAMSS